MSQTSIVLQTTLIAILSTTALHVLPTRAVQVADGTVYFTQPPRLDNAIATFSSAYSPAATYYFTLTIPQDAGEPLQRVTFTQEQGAEPFQFQLSQTEAFEGTRSRPGPRIALKDITANRDTRTVSIAFDPPIAPGKTLTIALRPVRNPGVKGTYLIGVRAVPVGEKSYSQFLGYGRFQIRRRGGV